MFKFYEKHIGEHHNCLQGCHGIIVMLIYKLNKNIKMYRIRCNFFVWNK